MSVIMAIECLTFQVAIQRYRLEVKARLTFSLGSMLVVKGEVLLGTFQMRGKIPLTIHGIDKRLRSISLISGTFAL